MLSKLHLETWHFLYGNVEFFLRLIYLLRIGIFKVIIVIDQRYGIPGKNLDKSLANANPASTCKRTETQWMSRFTIGSLVKR